MKKFKRIREWMDIPGRFEPGQRGSITDVPGVTVGHHTIHDNAAGVHTGVTIIRPHMGDVFLNKVPAAVYSGNGFGKMVGGMQIDELGEMESLIGLTNTFSVGQVLQGLLDYHCPKLPLTQRSINITIGETNDAFLNDVMSFHVRPEHVRLAIDACSEDVEEGAVGAGAGTYCYGFKGGIGTASRLIPGWVTGEKEQYTIGTLVQTNFGGCLNIYGHRLPHKDLPVKEIKGSCMIVVATDAPILDRQLSRIAKRAIIGMTNTGSFMNHHSGDFAIAFSNCPENLRDAIRPYKRQICQLSEEQLTPFFEATVEAVQEAVYNSLTMARDIEGFEGRSAKGFNIEEYRNLLPLRNSDCSV